MTDPILAISAFTLTLSLLGEKGELLYHVKQWLEKRFTYTISYKKVVTTTANASTTFEDVTEKRVHWLFKPVWGCPACMASVWGTIVYWTGAGMCYWPGDWFGWIVSCMGACFLNLILWKTFNK